MRYILSSLAVLMVTSGATAASVVLEFDDVPDFGGGCTAPEPFVVESGISIGNCPQSFTRPGTIHLDDSGSAYNSLVQFSGPTPFDAISVEIIRLGWEFKEDTDVGRIERPYDNLAFRGFRDGVQVADQVAFTFESGGTFLFDAGFSALDLLEIEQVLPNAVEQSQYPDGDCCVVDYRARILVPM